MRSKPAELERDWWSARLFFPYTMAWNKAMRALVLFKGTGSIDRALVAEGFDVVSLDIDPKCRADVTCDIRDWVCPYPAGHFDYIWASPDCTQYTCALTVGEADMELADSVVLSTLAIIDELKPAYWTIENPGSGKLKHRPFMAKLEYVDVCYCKYGYPYRKWTRLWGNVPFGAIPMCTHRDRCAGFADGQHVHRAQRGTNRGQRRASAPYPSKKQLYSVPPLLCADIARALSRVIRPS